MTPAELREAVRREISRPLANMLGGCFKAEHRTQRGDCADGDCYCARVAGHCADAALRVVREAMREPTQDELLTAARAYARKYQDNHSAHPTEHPAAGGGPIGYAIRAYIAASPLREE